jgi:serine/threonine protein kinase
MLTMTGTPDYRAPEMFEGGGYDEMVDMWALGVSIYQLMTGITPFYSMYPSGIVANISKADV